MDRAVGFPALALELARRTSYVAEGVVAVVGSPYAPLYGPASAVAAALVTGNAVLLKAPPTVTATLVAYAEALPAQLSLLQVVTGDDATTTALTDAKGLYRVRLPEGRYAVRTNQRPFGTLPEPRIARVVAKSVRRVDFHIDTGIR